MRTILLCIVSLIVLSAPVEGQTHVTESGYPACLVRSDFDDFISILASGDREAAVRFLANSTCVMLRAGVEVYVRGAKGFGVIQIRPAGSTIWLFTNTEAARRK